MSFNLDSTNSPPNLSIAFPGSSLNLSADTKKDISLQKIKEELNNSILSVIKELEGSKRDIIINSANKIKAEYNILANLIKDTDIKIEKCNNFLNSLNVCNDQSIIAILSEKFKRDIDNSFMNILELNEFIDKSFILKQVEKLEYNVNEIIDFQKDLVKFYEILNTKVNWASHKKIRKLEKVIEKKWNIVEDEYIKNILPINPKLNILIQANNYANSLYQRYITKVDQSAKKYQEFHKYIEENKRNKNHDSAIYLGMRNEIIEFDTSSEMQIYHYGDNDDDYYPNCSSWIIKLPNDELLCCGVYFIKRCGRAPYPSKISKLWILDTKTFKLKKWLPYLEDIEKCAGLFYNNSIYLFGNRLSVYFDTQLKMWKRLASIDINYRISCILFNKAILLCENGPKVYKYDFDIDSYSDIGFELSSELKLLAFSSERAYIIEFDGYIYESEIENEYHWNPICQCLILEDVNQIYWVADSYCIMFGIYNEGIEDDCRSFHYYLFDFKNKSLDQAQGFKIKWKQENAPSDSEELCSE